MSAVMPKAVEPESHEKKTLESADGNVLQNMLRVEIDFPSTRVCNLSEEYQEFLDENSLVDERELKKGKQPEDDGEAGGDDSASSK